LKRVLLIVLMTRIFLAVVLPYLRVELPSAPSMTSSVVASVVISSLLGWKLDNLLLNVSFLISDLILGDSFVSLICKLHK
jgi:hypothetical protein